MMRFKEMRIQNFRGIKDAVIDFKHDLTTLVGENGTGKTTTCLAISRILSSVTSGLADPIQQMDHPFSVTGSLAITLTLELAPQDIHQSLISQLVPRALEQSEQDRLVRFLDQETSEITLKLPSKLHGYRTAELQYGQLNLTANRMAIGSFPAPHTGESQWNPIAERIAGRDFGDVQLEEVSNRLLLLDAGPPAEVMNVLGQLLRSRFKISPEFRTRTPTREASAATDSWQGSQVTSALYNLMNHPNRDQRDRYDRIKLIFENLFPRYEMQAVLTQPGSNIPEILFYEQGQDSPLSLSELSAGEHEILTFLTNLVSQEGLVVFIEQPETTLHPHGMRFLQSALIDSASQNQIITATHSPYFVSPESPDSLRRFWRTDEGTKVRSLDLSKMREREQGQIRTALSRLDRREVVFARAVVLVEEETTLSFLYGIAPKLGFDLDAHAVSIISVDGGDGFRPYHTLLESLGIPHANLRDDSWGHHPNHPPDRFFSLGVKRASFEKYMDSKGFADLQKKISKQIGKSKPRRAAELARRLRPEQIPPLFRDVLMTTISLAAESPLP